MNEHSQRLNARETAEWLRGRDGFLILSHKRPDGDALGSACALALGLRRLGKTAWIFPNPEITPRYAPYCQGCIAPADYEPACVLTVDTASLGMFPKNSDALRGRVDLSIDHHGSHEDYSSWLCLEGDSASCGEIVYEILLELGISIDRGLADLLYIAVSTDTGCFRQANTTARSLLVASRLVEAGADHVTLNRALFEMKSRGRLAAEAAILRSMRFSSRGRVAVAILRQAEIDAAGITEDDLDNISSLVQQTEGVLCGALIREKPGYSKVSVRSSGGFDASRLCSRFGGGGHVGAAGCELRETPERTAELIEAAAEEELGA